jgi:ribosome-binding factor A
MKNYRREKLTESIMQALEVIVPHEMSDNRLTDVKIHAVVLNKDMSHVKAYFSLDDSSEEPKKVQSLLNKAASFIRTQLAESITMGYTPSVSFVYDESCQSMRRVGDILDKISQNTSSSTEE